MATAAVVSCALGKAGLLRALAGRLHAARVPASLVVDLCAWPSRSAALHGELLVRGIAARLAVRSARVGEDHVAGNAGRYLSLIGIDASRPEAFENAVQAVFDSYGETRSGDAVLLQPAIDGIRHAIVAAGGRAAPYRSISIAGGTDSAAITRGDAAAESWYLARDGATQSVPTPLAAVDALLAELEPLLDADAFEIEAVDSEQGLWLLQVRPLPSPPRSSIDDCRRSRRRAGLALQRASAQGAGVLGLMPDWNPAELLGEHPRPLALSVFEALIGSNSWWRARADLGYARPYRAALLQPIAGRPYVDVRASLESLLPALLPTELRARLVQHWQQRLRDEPTLHDRIEFELAVSGTLFDFESRLDGIDGFRPAQWRPAFDALTVAALERPALLDDIDCFERSLAGRDGGGDLAARLLRIRDRLALPFARAARRDFLAAALWRSAVRIGALDATRWQALLAASCTGAGETLRDGVRLLLRAGQFEIDAPWRESGGSDGAPSQIPFALQQFERRELAGLLDRARMPWTPEQLVERTLLASRARELGKRALATALGDWFDGLAQHGARVGYDRDALGWLTLGDIRRSPDTAGWQRRIDAARRRHALDATAQLPPVLCGPQDLERVRLPAMTAHFLGRGVVDGAVQRVGPRTERRELQPGAVLLIASADPGYDWIFAARPAALVTAYGGPHSHMALRCADVGCAAVLGVGPQRFERLAQAARLRIDLSQQRIETVPVARPLATSWREVA